MQIGSFIELQLPGGREYYREDRFPGLEIARLNTGRAAIYHAFRLTGCKRIWIPYYQCESVRNFLSLKNVSFSYYHIDGDFCPAGLEPAAEDAVLLVNYYGIFSDGRMRRLAEKYDHPILDNSQAFFAKPVLKALNVYSARKFAGVPDGAYVVGKGASGYLEEYPQGYSSDTSLFLLQRIEYGCEGKAYASRTLNEERVDNEDIMKMSPLTHALLDGTDYDNMIKRRRENYRTAKKLFDRENMLTAATVSPKTCVPMVYPFLMEDDVLLDRLLAGKHFQGHWWNWVLKNPESNEFEKWVSRYMVPLTIDQRYGAEELCRIRSIVDADGTKG